MPRQLHIISRTALLTILLTPLVVLGSGRFPKPTVVDGTLQTNQVKIHWEKQTKVKRYQLRLFNGTCSDRLAQYRISRHKTRKVIKELEADTKYCVKIRAKYQDGTQDRWSHPRKFRTLEDTAIEIELPDVGPQFGVNFIRFFSTDNAAITAATQPDMIDADFTALFGSTGVFRQITSADLIWSQVEINDNQFDFTDSDAVLLTTNHEPVVDLFSYQYADSTTPWEELMGDDTPELTLTATAEDYITNVVERYKDDVTYWEIGNEMAHWELTNPGEFPVADQATWLAAVAAKVREHDADAQILLPGMINITADNVDDWLPAIVASSGSDWFDIISYHDYNRWQSAGTNRAALQTVLTDLGIDDKPVWLTEMGTTSDVTLTRTTNYPNSTTEQAADIFRRTIQSYAAGDALAIWHTYIGNDDAGEEFRYHGLINEDLSKAPAYYTTQLLTGTVLPFVTVETVDDFVYKITKTDGTICYVAWSATTGTLTVPDGVSQMTSVVPANDGTFNWTSVTPGDTINLNTIPVLLTPN